MIRYLLIFALAIVTQGQPFRSFVAWDGAAKLSVSALQNIQTESSATPSIVKLTVPANHNAIRIWSTEYTRTEPTFDLSVSKNGAAVKTIRIPKWTSRIIAATPGSIVALGTADGRTLQVCTMTLPSALITPSGVTGTAVCDKAGPPIWVPTAPHITLPANNSAFQFAQDSTERIVFISEFDGSAWSNPRWVWTRTNTTVNVQCTYSKVALANYAGTALSVTAPAGATIGGTSATMTLEMPAYTGTLRTVTTMAELKTAMAAAVSGDRIYISAGTYALDINVSASTFTANVAAGNKACEGIQFLGATGNPDDVVLTGSDGANGGWSVTYTGSSSVPVWFSGLTFNFSGINGGLSFVGGNVKIENCTFLGPNTSGADLLSCGGSAASDIKADIVNSRVANGGADNVNLYGGLYNSTSLIRVIGVTSTNSGPLSNDQCLTSHGSLPVYIYGGTYGNATINVFASDADTSPIIGSFVQTGFWLRSGNLVNYYGFCGFHQFTNVTSYSMIPVVGASIQYSRIYGTNASQTVFRSYSGTVSHNVIANTSSGGTARAFHLSNNSLTAVGNIVRSWVEGFRLADYSSGVKGNYTILNNTVINTTTAFYALETAGQITYITNNITKANSSSIYTTATADAFISGNYNVLEPTVDADYTIGDNDITNADGAIDDYYVPTASGNADGNGLNVYNYIGDSDPFGRPFLYGASVPRGAVSVPVTTGDLWPDVY